MSDLTQKIQLFTPKDNLDILLDKFITVIDNGQNLVPSRAVLSYLNSATTANMIDSSSFQSTTKNGILFTKTSEGLIKLDGTADADGSIDIGVISGILPNVSYRLIGCPPYGSNSKAYLRLESNSQFNDNGSGVTSTVSSVQSNKHVTLYYKQGSHFDSSSSQENPDIFYPVFSTNLTSYYKDFVLYTGTHGKLNQDFHDLLIAYLNLLSTVNNMLTTISNQYANSVQYTALSKTDAEKAIARENIDAIDKPSSIDPGYPKWSH